MAFAQNSGTINITGASGAGSKLKVAVFEKIADQSTILYDTIRPPWCCYPIDYTDEIIDQIGVDMIGDTLFVIPSGSYLLNLWNPGMLGRYYIRVYDHANRTILGKLEANDQAMQRNGEIYFEIDQPDTISIEWGLFSDIINPTSFSVPSLWYMEEDRPGAAPIARLIFKKL